MLDDLLRIAHAVRHVQPALFQHSRWIAPQLGHHLHGIHRRLPAERVKDAQSAASFFTGRFGSAAAIMASTSARVMYSGSGAFGAGGR